MKKETIGSFIAVLRKANGMTQRELADKLSVSDKAVSRWERDEALPDLSLIPVLAEIFDITCDELLKGQRIDRSAVSSEQTAAKTEKQLRNHVQATRTKYQIHSILSVGLVILGVFGAMLCNFGFLRSYIGFWIATVFFLAAQLWQLVVSVQTQAQISNADLPEDRMRDLQTGISGTKNLVQTLCWASFGWTLPLFTFGETYAGLNWDTLFPAGMIFAALCAAAYWLLTWLLGLIRRLRQGQGLTNIEKLVMKRLLLVILILALCLGGSLLIFSLDYKLFAKPQVFDSWDAFQSHMETPVTYHGLPMTFLETWPAEDQYGEPIHNPVYIFTTQDGSQVELWDIEQRTVENAQGHVLCTYRQWNCSIAEVVPNQDSTDTLLPVACYTYESMEQVHQIYSLIVLLLFLLGGAASLWILLRKAV